MAEQERQSERVAVYVTPSFRKRLSDAIESSGIDQSNWLRRLLEAEVVRYELAEFDGEDHSQISDHSSLPPTVALAAAEARIQGQDEIIKIQRERIGMADALNVELTKRLEASQTSMDRLTLMLPAPEEFETNGHRGFNWRFWER